MSQKSYTVSLDTFLIRNTLLLPLWRELPFILLFIPLSGVTCWRLLANNSQAKYLKIPRSAHVSCLLWSKRWDRAGICIVQQNGQEPVGGFFLYSHKQNSSKLLIRIPMDLKHWRKEITPDIFTFFCPSFLGVTRCTVGWGSALQTGRSRVWFPLGSLRFFHWINPSGRIMALGSTQSLTEMGTRLISWGYSRPVRRADNPITFMCPFSRNSRSVKLLEG